MGWVQGPWWEGVTGTTDLECNSHKQSGNKQNLKIPAFTDKCTVNCENGGKVTQNCGCDCAHGFTGER